MQNEEEELVMAKITKKPTISLDVVKKKKKVTCKRLVQVRGGVVVYKAHPMDLNNVERPGRGETNQINGHTDGMDEYCLPEVVV